MTTTKTITEGDFIKIKVPKTVFRLIERELFDKRDNDIAIEVSKIAKNIGGYNMNIAQTAEYLGIELTEVKKLRKERKLTPTLSSVAMYKKYQSTLRHRDMMR